MRARWPLLLAIAVAGCSPNAKQLTQTWPPPPQATAPTLRDFIAARPDLSTLARAVTETGADRSFAGSGPFTMFAPTDAALARLAPGTMDRLTRPENRASLMTLVRFWVARGRFTAADLRARIAAGGGRAVLATVEGEPLTVTVSGDAIELIDARGDRSYLETADGSAGVGVVHTVNGVLLPAALG